MALSLRQCGAFGAVFCHLKNGIKSNLVLCFQAFHAIPGIAASELRENRRQTTNFYQFYGKSIRH
jgi:hypothetical protein